MIWEVEHREEFFEFRRTTLGRLGAAVGWAIVAVPVAAFGGVLFFGIDYVGRTSAGVGFQGDFWLTVLLFAFFCGFVAFVIRLMRYRRWIVDPKEGTIALSHRRAFGEPRIVEVPLVELVRVERRHVGPGPRVAIVLVFDDSTEETFAASWRGASALEPIVAGLRQALEGTDVEVVDAKVE